MVAAQKSKIQFSSSNYLAVVLMNPSIFGKATLCFPKTTCLLVMSISSPTIPLSGLVARCQHKPWVYPSSLKIFRDTLCSPLLYGCLIFCFSNNILRWDFSSLKMFLAPFKFQNYSSYAPFKQACTCFSFSYQSYLAN